MNDQILAGNPSGAVISSYLRGIATEATTAGGIPMIVAGAFHAAAGDYVGGGLQIASGLLLTFVPENKTREQIKATLDLLSDPELRERLRAASGDAPGG